MNLLYLSDSVLPSKRANTVHVMRMSQAFSNKGLSVELLAMKGDTSTETHAYYGTDGFKVSLTIKPIRFIGLWCHAMVMFLRVKKLKPKYIFGRSLFGAYLSAKLGYPVFFETHEPYSVMDSYRKYFFKGLIKSPNLKGLVVISNALKHRLLNELDELDSSFVLAVHDGANLTKVSEEEIKSYYWPSGNRERIQIGYIGTISQGRGIELVIECAQAIPEADFHIIGGEVRDLEKINYNIDHVKKIKNIFFHGFIPPSKTIIARKKCDILLAPYQKDLQIRSKKNTSSYMSPLKVFEYMDSGGTIIASDLDVLREVLISNEDSILVNSSDKLAWIKAIKALIENPKLRKRLATAATVKLINTYSWEKRADYIINFINQKLNECSHHHRTSRQ